MKFFKSSERGQALILIVFGIIGMIGMTALAIDGGTALADRRQAQNAADTAALAAAVAYVNADPDWQGSASASALNYGFNNDGVDNIVTVHKFDPSNPDDNYFCSTLDDPASCGEYIQVTIESHVPTSFARVSQVETNEIVNTVTAIARGKQYKGSSGSPSPLFNGYAVVALDPDGDSALDLSGSAITTINGGGLYTRSNHDRALTISGNATVNSATQGLVAVGGARLNGNVTVNSDISTGRNVSTTGGAEVSGAVIQNATVPTFESQLFPKVEQPDGDVPTCSGSGGYNNSGATIIMTPGNHPGRSITGTKDVLMQPGNYCFSGDFSMNGTFTVTAESVAINMGSHHLILGGGVVFNATNSYIYEDSGNLNVGGDSHLNISNTPIYLASGELNVVGDGNPQINSTGANLFYLGTGDLNFNGNSTFTTTGTTFYLNIGTMTWNGNARLDMSAPTGTNTTLDGLLIYMPPTNTSTLTLNGNSNATTTGTIFAPGAQCIVSGNSGTTTVNSQFVCWRFAVGGSANTVINYNGGQNSMYTQVTPGENGRIELIK